VAICNKFPVVTILVSIVVHKMKDKRAVKTSTGSQNDGGTSLTKQIATGCDFNGNRPIIYLSGPDTHGYVQTFEPSNNNSTTTLHPFFTYFNHPSIIAGMESIILFYLF